MTFRELQQKANSVFPALLLESVISHKSRVKVRKVLFTVLIFAFIFSAMDFFISDPANFFVFYSYNLNGLFFIVFVLWFIVYMLELLYFSYYFKESELDFEVAKIVSKTPEDDITRGFLDSVIGHYTMQRLGLSRTVVQRFYATRRDKVEAREYEIFVPRDQEYIDVSTYGRTLIHFDLEFATLLKKHGIDGVTFVETLGWVTRTIKRVRRKEVWWSKENLARIPSIGGNWAFGKIYLLERYGHPIYIEDSYITLGDAWRIYVDYVERLEKILVKDNGANVMLVVDETASGLEIVSSLAKMTVAGLIHPKLERKKIYILEPDSVLEGNDTKASFEKAFKNILAQAASAGNVIIVFPHMAEFLEQAHSLSVDVGTLLADALRSSSLQIIGLTTHRGYSSTIEPHRDLVSEFSKVNVDEVDEGKVIELLENEVHRVESREDIFFTFPAMKKIVSGAERFYTDKLLSTAAFDVLYEVVAHARDDNKELITREYVTSFLKGATGIPQGPLSSGEGEKLLNLEKVLHKRVIGQDGAISAISAALRRSRAGLASPGRPIGSFLFLGPTGVGKTETAKALTEVLFGDQDDSIRLDMSEYQGSDALERLIGTTSTPGVLAVEARKNPYAVLLLDEFEKTTEEVHNLFLQILDEGFFTNGLGEKIYLRNMVIVATSNAGSDEIFKMVSKEGKLPDDAKEMMIKFLIDQGHFKPELLNRFDDAVVFNPLGEEELRKVSKIMVGRLNKRLGEKGISIEVTPDLIEYLVEVGMDKEFGARAMNRAIQDSVERLVADAIIGGQVDKGEVVRLEVGEDGDLEVI